MDDLDRAINLAYVAQEKVIALEKRLAALEDVVAKQAFREGEWLSALNAYASVTLDFSERLSELELKFFTQVGRIDLAAALDKSYKYADNTREALGGVEWNFANEKYISKDILELKTFRDNINKRLDKVEQYIHAVKNKGFY